MREGERGRGSMHIAAVLRAEQFTGKTVGVEACVT